MQTNVSSLAQNDAYQIVDNLDRALSIFRRHEGREAQTTLDVSLQSMLTTLRREMLDYALRLQQRDEMRENRASW